jgi:hypothetical protein
MVTTGVLANVTSDAVFVRLFNCKPVASPKVIENE